MARDSAAVCSTLGEPEDARVHEPVNTDILEYIVNIEVNVSQAILFEQIKSSLESISSFQIDTTTEIESVNITTVCHPNGSEYQCICEDQYFWSFNNCIVHNACNDLYEGVCTCIDIIPSDGQMCVTKSELPFFDILVEIELNTTSTMLDEVRNLIGAFSFPITFGHVAEITDVAITAVNTTTIANKTNTNTTTTSTATTRTTATPSIQTTTLGAQVLSFSLTINEVFDFALTDQSSEKYNTYKQKIESSIDKSYRTLLSYEPNSATVTAFRPGSVITDFTIKTTNATLNLASANQDLASSLRLQGFDVSDTAFIQSVKDGLYGSSGNIYPGTNLTLTCNPPVNNSIQWTMDGKLIEDNSNNILQLNNATSDYSGQYACTTTVNSIPYVIWQIITIQPYPNIEVSTNKVVQCEDTTIPLQCCVQEIYQVEWTISCTSPLTGSPAGCILCDYTLKQNDCQTAEQEKHITCKLKNPINGITTQSYNSKSIIVNVTNKDGSDVLYLFVVVFFTFNFKNFLQTTDVIGSDDTRDTWVLLNKNSTTMNASSELLNSTERIARRLRDESISIITNISSLKKTSITAPFSGTFGKNLTTQINIPATSTQTSLTVIISSAFNNVLPVRSLTNNNSSQTDTSINGDVVLIETNSTINNISLSFDIKNNTLGNPQCVFWNFNLLNDIGGWDSTGCQLKKLGNETERITCECNHTTSFSILMSPFTLDKNLAIILDYITYIGVAISLGSLVLCLIIEMIIWKSVTRNDTSYMRHVSIVNIAVSLLIANICFIIGAAVVKKGVGPCSTATFFMHFFYLALFFWMLLSALLLLYRTLMVFSRMTRGAMMAIAFTVGYGAPLIIAVITVASTAGSQGYIQKDYNCWLNWSKTKALLAFVIPALTIVAINLLVLIVVLCKMLRRGVNATTQPDEKHPLMVIARCVAILTPLFGLTWGFGIGTMVSPNFGIHVVFAFLNSLQGFFILMFGTLLDSKVREALAQTFSLSNLSSIRTRSTTAGPSSSSGFPFFQRLRQRNVYNVLSPKMSSSNSDTATDSYAARPML
ncbi:adhesion G protein-coupled receptor F5-like [Ictalurus furcatus]|uniref:adhesion G protein-coupled receptor F5-like n=1 Tax=Ictalurus furcatus TaxID=66913 RepID=UPI002350A970|nr:adhesion G protein-coupled receptor F5-like [Ictalurus furcatus]